MASGTDKPGLHPAIAPSLFASRYAGIDPSGWRNIPLETEHRNAPTLENAKTLYLLVFSGRRDLKYTAGFLNRVSQVRILPRAPIPVSFVFIDLLGSTRDVTHSPPGHKRARTARTPQRRFLGEQARAVPSVSHPEPLPLPEG